MNFLFVLFFFFLISHTIFDIHTKIRLNINLCISRSSVESQTLSINFLHFYELDLTRKNFRYYITIDYIREASILTYNSLNVLLKCLFLYLPNHMVGFKMLEKINMVGLRITFYIYLSSVYIKSINIL